MSGDSSEQFKRLCEHFHVLVLNNVEATSSLQETTSEPRTSMKERRHRCVYSLKEFAGHCLVQRPLGHLRSLTPALLSDLSVDRPRQKISRNYEWALFWPVTYLQRKQVYALLWDLRFSQRRIRRWLSSAVLHLGASRISETSVNFFQPTRPL